MAEPNELKRQELRERRLANALSLEEIRASRLAAVAHREKRRRQLTEAASLDWVSPYSDMLDRFRPNSDPVFSGSTNYWNRRYGKNWPVFQTEQELAILRAPARLMLATNDYAIGLVNGISAYVIGVGYTYRPAKRRKESTIPPEVLEALQGIVDEILEANEWKGGEQPGIEDECFWRSLEDGEFGVVEYPQSDGLTEFRIFEPEQLTQPPGSNYYDWLFGVCTDPEDVQKPLAYWLQWGDSPGEGEEYPPDRITHFRRNGRRGQKRGLTDFCFGHYDRMNLANNLLLNLGDTATQQASIPYVMEHETATQAEVQTMRDDMADFMEVETPSGASVPVKKSRRGMGQDIPKGQKYVDGPGAPYSDKHLAILDACLRGAVARWNGFEWLISANAGNNNLPVDLSAESPFVRRVLKEQNRYTGAFKKPVWRAVEHYVRTRGLRALARDWTWEEIAKEVDLLVKAPSPQTRNRLEEAQIASIEIPMGVDSRQSYMQTQGRDPDQIEADNQAWQDEHGNDGQQLPLPGEGVGPKMLDSLGRKIHRQPATE